MPKVIQILNFEFFEEQQHNLGMKGLKTARETFWISNQNCLEQTLATVFHSNTRC